MSDRDDDKCGRAEYLYLIGFLFFIIFAITAACAQWLAAFIFFILSKLSCCVGRLCVKDSEPEPQPVRLRLIRTRNVRLTRVVVVPTTPGGNNTSIDNNNTDNVFPRELSVEGLTTVDAPPPSYSSTRSQHGFTPAAASAERQQGEESRALKPSNGGLRRYQDPFYVGPGRYESAMSTRPMVRLAPSGAGPAERTRISVISPLRDRLPDTPSRMHSIKGILFHQTSSLHIIFHLI
ncbi:uncharacterized protein [Palaemon carinicauda]|uniref:uncharacterized protein n=1 Tax=Palaemon carinicauda TaxID=392227 RepID=UPI0035B64B87